MRLVPLLPALAAVAVLVPGDYLNARGIAACAVTASETPDDLARRRADCLWYLRAASPLIAYHCLSNRYPHSPPADDAESVSPGSAY